MKPFKTFLYKVNKAYILISRNFENGCNLKDIVATGMSWILKLQYNGNSGNWQHD